MSEADRLWREAAEMFARFFAEKCPTRTDIAWDAQFLPRPAGWGEGGKGDE